MDKDLERLIKYIRKEEVVLFIGSGFSIKAGAPSVWDIINAILEEGGQSFKDDLTESDRKQLRLVSEAFVNECDGRNDLMTLLKNLFVFEPKDCSDQQTLTKIPHIKQIFTTNYDTLIEDAYPKSKCNIVTANEGCAYTDAHSTTIYKVHGDIATLNNSASIIITDSDYKNYFKNKHFNLIWEELKQAFIKKHVVFIGYSLEDDNILDIIKTVRDCIGSSMKGMFLVAPHFSEFKKNKLKANHVTYIDALAEEVLTTILSSIKENIADDVRHNNVSKETYDKFVDLNGNILTTLRKTEYGNEIDKLEVKQGQKRKETISFTIPNEIMSEINDSRFNDEMTVVGSSIKVPAYKIPSEKMINFSHHLNGIKFNGKDDISCLYIAPTIQRHDTKFKIPSIKFTESVTIVKYRKNGVIYIDMETPICFIKIELHTANNKIIDVTSRVESKETYKNNSEALKWIDALIAMCKQGQIVKFDGISITSNQTNRNAIAEFNKVKAFYKTIRDIENDTDVIFDFYDQYSDENYINALYIYHYLTGKGFLRKVPQKACLKFVIDDRDENNMPIEKFRNDTFVMIECTPLGSIKLNGKEFQIPFRTTAYMDCHADSITAINEHDYEIVMKDAKYRYMTWCTNTRPKQEGTVLNLGNKRIG